MDCNSNLGAIYLVWHLSLEEIKRRAEFLQPGVFSFFLFLLLLLLAVAFGDSSFWKTTMHFLTIPLTNFGIVKV